MIEQTQTSTWQSKIKALGPGILMASAAVGGSHIVSSAQAGAMTAGPFSCSSFLPTFLSIHFSGLVLSIR